MWDKEESVNENSFRVENKNKLAILEINFADPSKNF